LFDILFTAAVRNASPVAPVKLPFFIFPIRSSDCCNAKLIGFAAGIIPNACLPAAAKSPLTTFAPTSITFAALFTPGTLLNILLVNDPL
jgi:hypothetical protein